MRRRQSTWCTCFYCQPRRLPRRVQVGLDCFWAVAVPLALAAVVAAYAAQLPPPHEAAVGRSAAGAASSGSSGASGSGGGSGSGDGGAAQAAAAAWWRRVNARSSATARWCLLTLDGWALVACWLYCFVSLTWAVSRYARRCLRSRVRALRGGGGCGNGCALGCLRCALGLCCGYGSFFLTSWCAVLLGEKTSDGGAEPPGLRTHWTGDAMATGAEARIDLSPRSQWRAGGAGAGAGKSRGSVASSQSGGNRHGRMVHSHSDASINAPTRGRSMYGSAEPTTDGNTDWVSTTDLSAGDRSAYSSGRPSLPDATSDNALLAAASTRELAVPSRARGSMSRAALLSRRTRASPAAPP